MQSQNVETVVQTGVGLMLVIMFLLGIAGMYQIRETNKSMSSVVHTNLLKVQLAHEMRDAIRLRENGLIRMLSLKDPFDRDEELIRFYAHAGLYRKASARLLELPISSKEKEIYASLNSVIRIAQPRNREAAEFIAEEKSSEKVAEAVKLASEQQKKLLDLLDQLVTIQGNRVHHAISAGTKKYDQSFFVVIMLGVIAILGALLIVRKVSKYVASKNQELQEKNQQLAEVSKEALSANKTKSAFLATMSHEIRTPLTAIIGFAETSLDSDQTLQERLSATKTIIQSGKHLLQIINDILDLSKIEANKLELEKLEFSPFELLAEVESIVKPLADAKALSFKLQYEFPFPKMIVSDPLRLKQIVINLVSNAIKFTEVGRVIVSTKYDVDNRNIIFTVIDSGIGMTEDQMEVIFNAFSQADSSTTRKYGGTGLGLSLSKELANRLGGDITAKSLKNIGSQFEVIVSAGNIIESEYITNESEIPDGFLLEEQNFTTGRYIGKILIADDNKNNQQLFAHCVNKLGVSLSVADNGEIAVAMAFDDDYDLVFMDMQMPVLNGLDAVRLLRDRGYKKPIIAFTASAMNKDKEECFEVGCNDFLSKPIDRKELHRLLAKYLQTDTAPSQANTAITSSLVKNTPDMADLVERYCAELPMIYRNMEKLEKDKNWDELNSLVHQLRGTGGGMGFSILTEIAGKITFQLANTDYEKVRKLIIELGNIIERIVPPGSLNNQTSSAA